MQNSRLGLYYRNFFLVKKNMSKTQVLSLYKSLLKESRKFAAYNFRQYALRKVRDSFRSNKNLNDVDIIREKIADGERNLALIKRQVLIGRLYSTDKLVIENVK